MSRNAPQFVTRSVLPEVIDGVNIGLKQLCTMRIPETLIAASDVYTVFNHARPLGISPGYDKTGRLIAISVSDGDNCRIIEFAQPPGAGRQGHRANPKASPPPPKSIVDGRKKLQDQILCRIMGGIYAFDMGPLAMSLHVDLNLRISNAVDIQSSFSAHDRSPLSSVEACVGKEPDPIHKIKIKANKLDKLFLQPIYDPEADPNSLLDLAERAWLSQFLPSYAETAFDQAKRINTEMMESSYLSSISKISNDSVKLDQKKPTQMTHKFSQSIDPSTNQVRLISSEYGSRIRGDKNIKMTVTGPNGEFRTKGTVAGSSGRSSTVNTDRQLTSKAILTVTSVGRDDKTSAEAQRDATILRFLQGTEKTSDNPWYQNIWSPANADGLLVWPKEWSQKPSQPPRISKKPAEARLNGSQQTAVNCMLSEVDDHRIVLVQGPPGTGKTSVIASFVDFSVNAFGRTGIWLVAQSNVAVKNIAEKLISSGFLSWKLLVSKDFHFEWHEHLYAKVLSQNVIRSEAFRFVSPKDLKDTNVILCTISMLSNAQIKKFTRSIPVRTLVVDEASQIEVGNYISIFSQFQSTLRKACFIGDDKQLPPFGQEEIQDLQSIFEVAHLNKHVCFLDTQYRMPPQIGDIISQEVYDGKLKSNPQHPITSETTACYFIDVPGKEKPLESGSFVNELEAFAALTLATKLQEQGKNYRVITPYDGQRNYIESQMQDAQLDWGDKCFNVDSFQGNEDDYIIVSVVRSHKLGFLNNLRRTNVMLTRCKKGMFIISSIKFLTTIGSESLVGKLYKEMSPPVILSKAEVDEGRF